MKPRAEYQAYWNARRRCTDPRDHHFKHYGARGIQFRFASFEDFFAAVGPRPADKVLDRIDNDGHYEAGNLRWVTRKESAANRRSLEHPRTRHDVYELMEKEGLSYNTAWQRIYRPHPITHPGRGRPRISSTVEK